MRISHFHTFTLSQLFTTLRLSDVSASGYEKEWIMKMKTRKTVITLSLLGLSALLSPAIMAADVTDGSNILAAARSATTPGEHEAVAKYYEDTAKAMRAK